MCDSSFLELFIVILLLKATVPLQINSKMTVTLAFYPIYLQHPQPLCQRPTSSVWLADSSSGPTKHLQLRD